MTSPYTVSVTTGDKKNAGTDANVNIRLHATDGTSTDVITLDKFFRNDFEKGRQDDFHVTAKELNDVDHIEIWRDSAGVFDDWYLNIIEVLLNEHKYVFPFYRWIKPDYHYKICNFDTSLPSDSHPFKKQREMELEEQRKLYEIGILIEGFPAKLKSLPVEEQMSWDYKWDLKKLSLSTLASSKIQQYTTGRWTGIKDLTNVYTDCMLTLPDSAAHWKEDAFFANQRLVKSNQSVIRLCTAVPGNMKVTDAMVKPVMEGLTLKQAIQAKRLFYIDYNVLDGIPCKKGFTVCAPIALFFVNKEKQLMPVAIQLKQKPAADNPIFLPTDPEYTWITAKLWFNNADGAYQQSWIHLGATHRLMEGIFAVMHRNLSKSHPVFKLLLPHSLFLLAINAKSLGMLIDEGGFFDQSTNVGTVGMTEIVKRVFPKWRMDQEGTPPKQFENRGVLDENLLPGYHYREDALPIYHIIVDYVTKYVALYYDSPKKLTSDKEIQGFGREMVKPMKEGGCELQGVPGKGQFTTNEQLVTCLTSIIFTCSVGHAAANYTLYEDFGFPLAYPSLLRGKPPADKSPLNEESVMATLPDKAETLNIMTINRILGMKGDDRLGHYEVQYIVDPKALPIVEEFKYKLRLQSLAVKEKNRKRNPTYTWMDPDGIPSSITV